MFFKQITKGITLAKINFFIFALPLLFLGNIVDAQPTKVFRNEHLELLNQLHKEPAEKQ